MKIVVFGATGRTGLPFVQQALAAGHEVIAFARTPSKLNITHPCLRVVQGDSTDAAAVERAIAGTDVVVSALGHGKNTPRTMMADSARHIVAAMKKHGVRRIITMTGAGVGAPEDQPKPINHFIKFMLKTLSPQVLKDSEDHVQIIKDSGLDWTVVRGPMLTEGAHTGKYRVGWVGVNTSARISRADVADFMLKQVAMNDYLKKMPMVSD
jgi:putative NADH-flavin reductase